MTAALSEDYSAFVTRSSPGEDSLNLLINDVHCAGCIATVERAMQAMPGVIMARVNLSTRRLALRWRAGEGNPADIINRLEALGYPAIPCNSGLIAKTPRSDEQFLLRSLAVAGFAAGNVMLLSVAVWAGVFTGMADTTRELMHWVSALIALPVIVWSGRPFFYSAARAVRAGRLNMDVPISVALVVTAGISLFEVLNKGPEVYFDAAVMLLFFLLVGRYLDARTRGLMRSTVENLAAMAARPATVIGTDGSRERLPAHAVDTGCTVLVAAGERLPVDGIIRTGQTSIDRSLLTGESVPTGAGPGDAVYAGTVNCGDSITLTATATGEGTVLAEIVRLVEAAEQNRSRYVRFADRAARFYSPVVYVMAGLTFAGWWLVGAVTGHEALLIAVSVLIITCPCALGLAVPAVQVMACSRLLRHGVLVKNGDALERLAGIDAVVLDKTGTMTLGRPEPVMDGGLPEDELGLAASLAASSRHPLCQALARMTGSVRVRPDVREQPGSGLVTTVGDREVRLGNKDWCGITEEDTRRYGPETDHDGPELWFRQEGAAAFRIGFTDALREDAGDFVSWLRTRGFRVVLLSGDRAPAVSHLASRTGIAEWYGDARPQDKLARLDALKRAGHRVLMIGDGLNDAPSLAAADASISPADGADLAQTSADILFQGERLESVAVVIGIAHRAKRLVLQNFVLAAGYNAIAVPLAVAGLVTPLIAAAAMSASSIVVTLNALRLARGGGRPFQ